MPRDVLILDADSAFLAAMAEKMEEFSDSFIVVTAQDLPSAIEVLQSRIISVVVADVGDSAQSSGASAVENLAQTYPEIPLILTSSEEASDLADFAQKSGAVGLFKKPFKLSDMVKKISMALKKEGEAGTLRGVSPGMFLQMIEMEERSCVIRMEDETTESLGVLFFKDGELLDARLRDLSGADAAYEIFSWDEVSLSIQNGCPPKEPQIHMNAQGVLLEAMRRKDETDKPKSGPEEDLGGLGPMDGTLDEEEAALDPGAMASLGGFESELGSEDLEEPEAKDEPQLIEVEELEPVQVKTPERVEEQLDRELGARAGLRNIEYSDSMDGFIAQVEKLAEAFDAGGLVAAYLDRESGPDIAVVSGEKFIVLELKPRCPKNRVLQVLMS